MKYRLLDLLVDKDNQPFRLDDVSVEPSRHKPPLIESVKCSSYCAFRDTSPSDVTSADCRECFSMEVVKGRLVAQSGKSYRIANGVPRLIPEDVLDEQAQSTFSMEWRYSSDGQRNWGEPLEDRERKSSSVRA